MIKNPENQMIINRTKRPHKTSRTLSKLSLLKMLLMKFKNSNYKQRTLNQIFLKANIIYTLIPKYFTDVKNLDIIFRFDIILYLLDIPFHIYFSEISAKQYKLLLYFIVVVVRRCIGFDAGI